MEGERPLVVTEEYERLGGKKLSLIDVLAQSVGFMGPVFSAAFIIPLIIGVNASGRGAGTSAALAVLIAGIGVFALGWIVAQYAKKIHAAGSLYDYVSNGLGKTIGAATGWLYYGGTIILTTGLGLLIGGYVHDNLLPVLEIDLDLPIWVWDTIFALGLFAVLYFGVQISTRVQLTLALISIAVVLIFFITVIADLGGDNDIAKAFDPSPAGGFSGILFGVLYGVLIFVGFETAANLAEETAEPKRAIPRAVLGAVAIVSVFYLIAAYVEVAGFGFDLSVITSPEVAGAPLFALGAPPGPPGSEFWLKILLVVVFLDMLAVYVGAAVASTRGVFAMARDRRLPGGLAKVSKRYGTPVAAIVLLMVVQAILIVVSEANDTLLALPGLPALLLGLRVVRDVRRLRAPGRVLPDVDRGVPRRRGGQGDRRPHRRGARGDRDHGGGDLRVVLQGDEPDAAGSVVGRDLVRDRLDLHGAGQGTRARERRAGGPPHVASDVRRGRRGRPAPPRPHPEREPHARSRRAISGRWFGWPSMPKRRGSTP